MIGACTGTTIGINSLCPLLSNSKLRDGYHREEDSNRASKCTEALEGITSGE